MALAGRKDQCMEEDFDVVASGLGEEADDKS
jgi:hypothetical protein